MNVQVSYLIRICVVGLLTAGCGSVPGPGSTAGKSATSREESSGGNPEETRDERIERLLRECQTNPAVCDEAAEADSRRTLDTAREECLGGRWASCSFLYHAGPEGWARIQGEIGPLRWFKAPAEVQGRGAGGAIRVSVYRGTPVFRLGKEGAAVRVAFPQLYLVKGDSVGEAYFEASDAQLSAQPIALHPPPQKGRRVRGFERVLAEEPGAAPWMRTRCEPLFIVDEQKKRRDRYQRLVQVIDGVRVSGWTDEPIDYNLGPCFQENAVVFASDGPPAPQTTAVNGEQIARDLEAIWQGGFVYFEHAGEGASCVRRALEGGEVVSEWSGDGRRETWRAVRAGMHLIFFGPAVQHRDRQGTAYGGGAVYTVLGIEADAVIVTGGAEREEPVTAYRPERVRRWWRSKAACDRDRNAHEKLPRLKKKEIRNYAEP